MQRNFWTMSLVWFYLVAGTGTVVLAQPSTPECRSSGGPDICVRFDNYPTPPIEDTHFKFTFDTNGVPSVELLLGEDGQGTLFAWRVWSKDSQNVTAAIGGITAFGADDYEVKVLDEKNNDGASSVGFINLDPSDATKFSRINDGKISGALNGDVFLQGTAARCTLDVGGDVNGNITIATADGLTIGGNMNGSIAVTTVKNLTIAGDMTGALTVSQVTGSPGLDLLEIKGSTFGAITIGEIASGDKVTLVEGPVSCANGWSGGSVFAPVSIGTIRGSGSLVIAGHLQNDLTIDELRGQVRVFGHVGNNAQSGVLPVHIDIKNLVYPGAPVAGTFAWFGIASQATPTTPCSMFASIDLENGVNVNTGVTLFSVLESGSKINLMGKDVAGLLRTFLGGKGSIVNGGIVKSTGSITLSDAGVVPVTFKGSATFASVEDNGGKQRGFIGTQFGGDIDGTVTVNGPMDGQVYVDGDLVGTVQLGDSLSGDVEIGNTLTGTINVANNVGGDINVHGDVTSSASIALGGGLGRGRVLIDGLFDGDISIGEDTGSASLIHLLGGLDTNGRITINTGMADKMNASGDILVGPPKIPLVLDPITFDGNIHVNRGPATGGDLNGSITVVGCHATADALDICIDGLVNGKVAIVQTNCQNTVGWCCSPPCQ